MHWCKQLARYIGRYLIADCKGVGLPQTTMGSACSQLWVMAFACTYGLLVAKFLVKHHPDRITAVDQQAEGRGHAGGSPNLSFSLPHPHPAPNPLTLFAAVSLFG